jgi:endonuclease YncB( thermonuclease family)
MKFVVWVGLCIALLSACNLEFGDAGGGGGVQYDEIGRVTRVIDGDTIDVDINGETFRVRYVGINTPERDEVCYQDAVDANAALVANQTVGLVRDTSETDQYGRLLRYIYVGGVFVNEELVRNGFAEAVKYGSDDQYWDRFVELEQVATDGRFGCHASGIFDDGSDTR